MSSYPLSIIVTPYKNKISHLKFYLQLPLSMLHQGVDAVKSALMAVILDGLTCGDQSNEA